jgi:uncharacterized membrane protein YccF (DUF307 family)
MRLILNVIWLVLCSWWTAIAYALADLANFKIIPISLMPLGIRISQTAGSDPAHPVGRTLKRRKRRASGPQRG